MLAEVEDRVHINLIDLEVAARDSGYSQVIFDDRRRVVVGILRDAAIGQQIDEPRPPFL
ncbi:MAG TPA: hypothetical protein VGQ21_09870 [Thermoanaerobaculia bacterium]|nr:hypothetical protein [Thermoanaerobaculia bacterium]